MKNNFLSKAYGGVTVARHKLNGLGLPRQWKVITSTLLLLFTFAIGNVFGTDFDITLDQFRTKPISGLVKIDDSNLSLSGGALQLSSGNKDFTVSTTNSDYKIKKIVFTTTKAVIKYSGDEISENTFQPAAPGTSFTLNLTASGGTAKITQMVVTLTTATSETLEELFATALDGTTYTTGSTALTLTTVGGSFNAAYINVSKSSNERSLTISAASGVNIKFVAIYYYDAIFSRSITASTGAYDADTYNWTPGSTPTNTVTLTFNTGNSEGAKIRKIYVGYEAAATYNATFADGGHGTAPADATGVSSVTLTEITGVAGWKNTGWKADVATKVGTTDKAAGATLNIGDVVTLLENTTFTAQWAQTYAVTYDANGGGETMTDSNSPYIAGAEVTLLANAFTPPTGKEFDAWVVTETESGDPVAVSAGKFIMPSAAVTVKATWKDACALDPTVSATTLGTTSYTTQVVNCAGISVLGSAGCTISEYGFVYGTSTAPTISDNKKALEGDYTVAGTAFAETTLSGLASNTKYYVRAFATNSHGTAYGDEISFTTLAPLGNVLVVASSAGQTSDAITALRDNGFIVTVSAPNNSRDYTGYDLVVLDESLSGGNGVAGKEEGDIKGVNIPLLNLKSFFYNSGRWGWGTGNNGTTTNEIANISEAYCNAESHPIFAGLTIGAGGAIDLIDPAVAEGKKTLQGVTTNTLVEGKEGYTWATSGEGITFIHELTPAQRGVTDAKYLMVAFANEAKDNLSADGEKLIVNAAKYLIGSASWTPIPALSDPAIAATPSATYAAGDDISLAATATGTIAATTYTWYKGATLEAAIEAGAIQATATAAAGGNTYEKAGCVAGDAGIYWCVMSNGTGCDVNASLEVTISSASNITFVSAHGTAPSATTGASYTLPELTESGWAHQGWTASIDVTVDEAVVTAGTTIANGKVASFGADVEFTAVWAQEFQVTFNLKDHGTPIAPQDIVDGGKVVKPADPSESGWIFGGWYKENTCTNAWDFDNDVVTEDTELFAKWTEDPCPDSEKKSIVKVVLTSASDGTVTGYNSNEYAGEKVIGGLGESNTAEVDPSHEGVETGYKLSSGGSAIVFATLKKGTFQEGDRVVITITKPQDAYKVETVAQPILDIYYGTDKNDATFLTTLEGVSAAGTYTYRLTAADVTAIGTKKGIGVFRESSNGQNPYVYSVEITGCRSFAVTHDVNFNMMDHGDAITKQTIEVGAKVTEPAEPEAVGYIFGGWYKENTLVNKWNFSTDVMPDNDITLYAKWSEDPCTDRQSLVKVTMTAYNNASVAGYNNNEYAGGKIINGLSSSDENKNTADLGAGDVTGYKLSSNKYCVFATLAKGSFHVGDKVVIGMTSASGSEKIPVYAAKDKDNVALLGYIEGASAAGYYTYRLNSAAIDIINAAGEDYKSIGVYRTSSDYNLFIYSIELTGCREWTIYHSLTFMNIDGTATIAAESLEEGAYASTVAPTAPKIAMKRFKGWSESIGGTTVDLTSYTITEDKTLYAVYEDIVCPTKGKVFSMEFDATKTPEETVKVAKNGGTLDAADYATISGGSAQFINTETSDKDAITTDGKFKLAATKEVLKIELECALQEGDIIRVLDNSNKYVISTSNSKTGTYKSQTSSEHEYAVTDAWTGVYDIYLLYDGSGWTFTKVEIYRPAKYDVSFNMMGHGSAIADLEDVVEGSKIVAPSPAPTDVDYSFAGWYKENTLENEWKFDVDVVETNTTLYAKWLDKSDATLKSLKYGETDIVLVVDQDTYDITLPSLTSSVPALTAETNNPNATKLIANGTFDGAGNATSTVTVTPEVGADKVYTVNFSRGVALEQATVTASTEWDWSAAGVSAEIKESNTPGLSGNDVVIANVPGVKNDADFNSQALKASGTNAIRTEYFQGKVLNFKTDKEGLLIVDFGGTNGNARVLKVYDNADNEIAAWNYNSEARQVQQVVVPAGGVTLKAFEGASGNNARIYNLKFYALAYTRDDDWMAPGELGTVCYPEGLVAVGAEMYKMAGVDDNNKFVFDEVSVLDPGKPYLFVAQSNVLKFYATTATAAGAAGTNNGMVGTFASIDLSHTDARAAKWYYFSGKKFYAVSKRTSNLNVPANRAYVDMNESHPAGAPKHGVRRITFDVQGTNIATGIENAAATDKPAKMLINGQLFILRGEKMYDAKGQLVK